MPPEDVVEQPEGAETETPSTEPEVQSGPWSADLETYFEDPGVRAQVDKYMREKQQPYLTRQQQEVASAKDALEYYNRLQDTPGETFLELAVDLFGEEGAETVRETLLKMFDEGETMSDETTTPETPAPEVPTTPEPPKVELPDEVKEAIEFVRAQADKAVMAEYVADKAAYLEEHSHLNPNAFDLYVGRNEGDFDKARAEYEGHFGTAPAKEKGKAPVTVPGGANSAPTAKHYKNFDQALDDMFAESRKAPTTL